MEASYSSSGTGASEWERTETPWEHYTMLGSPSKQVIIHRVAIGCSYVQS